MAHILRVPETASSGGEVALSAWLVAENSGYRAGDTLVSLETDKAVLDVEAESDGVLLKILVPEGGQVEARAALAVLGAPGETADADALLRALGPEPAPSPGPVAPVAGQAGEAPVGSAEERARLFASPLARRIAREAGLDLAGIVGTGSNGRITRRDVERTLAGRSTVAAPTAADPARSPETLGEPEAIASGRPGPAAGAGYVDIPHSRIRRTIAARLVASKQNAPHFYLRGSAPVDDLLALREQINRGGSRVSITDFVLKAVAQAHLAVPAMNVAWTDEALRQYSSVDISVAVATEGGLVAPVLRDVGAKSLAQVSAGVKDLAARARAGRIGPEELVGGTVTVSNLGSYGTEEFAAIINPPQAAILAVGAARPEPVVRDGGLEVATVLRVVLSVDHRPVDGAVAADWMRTFLALLEAPARILAG